MALYQSGQVASADGFISDLNTFLAANGWTVDFFGLYSSHNRLHAHKGLFHVEIWYRDASSINIAGCTGYDSGSAPIAQPSVSATLYNYVIFSTANTYMFVSVAEGVYIFNYRSGYKGLIFLGSIVDKSSAWTDGLFISGMTAQATNNNPLTGVSGTGTLLYIDGAWKTVSAVASAGAVTGLNGAFSLNTKMPNPYNGGHLMVPIRVFERNATTASLLHPLGHFPSVRGILGGDVYVHGQEVPLGTDTWLATDDSAGYNNTIPSYMFKLA